MSLLDEARPLWKRLERQSREIARTYAQLQDVHARHGIALSLGEDERVESDQTTDRPTQRKDAQ